MAGAVDLGSVQEKMENMSMKDKLKAWRDTKGVQTVPESELVQDMIYVLQGIDGKYVKFQENLDSAPRPVLSGLPGYELPETYEGRIIVVNDNEHRILQPTQDLIFKLAELGWLYRKVQTVIRDSEQDGRGGMIKQSLFHAFQNQLTNYFRLIAILESRLGNKPMPGQANQVPDALPLEIDPHSGLTLKRLVVWTEEMRLRFRMMGVHVDTCQRARGGELVSLIHDYTSNGDPFIQKFTKHILAEVSVPFFHCLSKWIYQGELLDPYDEFFVNINPEMKSFAFGNGRQRLGLGGAGLGSDFAIGGLEGANNGEPETYRLWATKFSFRPEMLPNFLDEDYGKKIFSTGKSLNFIRYNCDNSDWETTKKMLKSLNQDLQYNDMNALEKSIDEAYEFANKRLFDIFFNKYRLFDHLSILKDYVMLGRGDFVDFLMESLGPSLSKPANTLYRHNLTATLEAAINNSTPGNNPPDLLKRLDARMLEFSRGEIGWDVFTLEYKVDSPIDTILDPSAMSQYLKMFHQLWKIKRVEYAVNSAWRQFFIGAHTFTDLYDLSGDFHQARIALSEMIHFIRQLQYYCHLEVIDCSWKELEEYAQRKEGDLDSFIETHRAFLNRLVNKTLLLNPKSSKPEAVLNQVRENLDTILHFRSALNALCEYAESEATRVNGSQSEDEDKAPSYPATPDPDILPSIRQKLAKHAGAFHENTTAIVAALASHPDLDLRFLSVRINFSLFYLAGKRKK